MDEIFSIRLEQHALGGLLKYPDVFAQIDSIASEYDFYQETHQTIFCVIKSAYIANEKLDKVLLAQKIHNLGVTFKDEINIFDYIENLYFTQITQHATIESFQELVKMRVLREIVDSGQAIQKFVRSNKDKPIHEIIQGTDKLYNDKLLGYQKNTTKFVDIFQDIEAFIEKKGNDFVNKVPPSEVPLLGPFPTINSIYGSLLRPGAINLVASRTGVGKTSLGMFYLTQVASQYNLPILHLDFGEMSEEELKIRATCMFTKGVVPFHALESGEWRTNKEYVTLVRGVWPLVKKLQMHYEDISTCSPEDVITLIRQFSYSKVGRGKRFLCHYDYLKPFHSDSKVPEHKEMGHFIQMVKSLITREIPASVWASLQLNRLGIVNNKTSEEVDDSENAFGISDRIIQQCTHAWLARPKLMDEIAYEGNRFGNLALKNMKARHLGREFKRHINPVKLPNGTFKRNYINIEGDTFYFTEKGDLVDMAKQLSYKGDVGGKQTGGSAEL